MRRGSSSVRHRDSPSEPGDRTEPARRRRCRRRRPAASATPPRSPTRSRRAGRSAGQREGTFNAPEPRRAAVRRFRPGRDPAARLRHGHVPVPVRRRSARRPPAGLHRHRRLRPLPADARRQRAAHDGLRRVRAAGRAVRGADRPAPARPRPTATSTSSCAQLRRLGLGHDERRRVATTDPEFYRWTQWIFLQIFNSWYDTDADQARPIAELIAELDAGTREPAAGHQPVRPALGRAVRDRQAPQVVDNHRLAYRSRVDGELGAGAGHRAGQRGGHCRRAQRARQLPGVPQAVAAVDDAHHRLRRPAGATTWTQIDWPDKVRTMQRNWIGRSTGAHVSFAVARPATIEVFTTRPGHAVRRDLHGAGARASDGRRADRRRVARGHAGRRGPAARRTRRRGRRVPGGRRAPVRAGPAGRRSQGQDRRVHRLVRDESGQRRADPGVHRRLRADGLRHRRDHGRARPGRARLGVRRERSTCRSSAPSQPPEDFGRQGVHRRRPGDQLRERRGSWTAWRSPRPRRRSSSGWRRTGTAAAR